MKTVIFACVHNAGRSQMAAAFFNAAADPMKAHAWTLGFLRHQPNSKVKQPPAVLRKCEEDLLNDF